jgi:hypothetical protein
MFILDRLLIGSLAFVLDKIAVAVDREMNDETALREELLAAQMRVELGEMSETEFAGLEREILQRLREIRERREGRPAAPHELTVTGVEARFAPDDDGESSA